ncbi:MAG: hypothetical protein A2086_16105 [Spirochaetes bacterium GWD1_27_9]|nr:MAG: hypothetical protein A2Z98_11730 [Spirochaetes bacterium GWB1_27_13]OHD22614.1 MAG: hypothetical protein A2Y34_07555 [Spirochaetes bacterium GWC1_27_15]OHD37318.1 MAG: hypothetical protein A2086_16105 [Spirochaetes bacterium GWD1_27_9]
MKILILTKLFPNEFSPVKGIFNKAFLDYFTKKEKISVTVISPIPLFNDFKKKNNKIYFHPHKTEEKNYTIFYPRIFSFGKFFLGFHYYFYLKKIKKFILKNNINFDIIHSHWLYPDGFVGVKLAKSLNKKAIVHCHGSDINFLLFDKRLTKQNYYTISNCDKLIVVSNALKAKIISKYPEFENKIIVINNAIDCSNYDNLEYQDSLKKLNLLDDKIKKIVLVGNVCKSKGVFEILQAAKILNEKKTNFKIYLIGKQYPNEIEFFKDFVTKNDLEDKIEFIGEVKPETIKYWFNIADFSLLPSHTEGFPLVIIESLASGTPVIASNVGGIPEIITIDEFGKIIESKNADQLATAILEFLDKKKNSDLIKQKAKKFDMSIQANKIMSEYITLINTN